MSDSEKKLDQELIVLDDEKDNLLDYEFDGIREFNNPPPPWLMWLFYVTIFFAAIYFVNMHVFKKGLHQDERYQREMAKANAALAEKKSKTDQQTLVIEFPTDNESIVRGEQLFKEKNCFACHGNNLEGNAVGPNLTDEYWIHGNSAEALVNIISNGNIQKGMTPYKDQISKDDILKLSGFIWSKQGSNPPDAKEPQGEKM